MVNTKNEVKEPLFHIEKRTDISKKQAIIIRAIAIVVGFVISSIIASIAFHKSPFEFFGSIFEGNFGSPRKIWVLFRDTAILLIFALAVVPAFRMRFWNLGADGQVLMGCLATTFCMYYLTGKVPNVVLYICMFVTAVMAGVVWAVLPAIFKAFFKTNESLFTLMMNYIAQGLVAFTISSWITGGTGVLDPIYDGMFPEIGNAYLLVIIVAVIITVFMYFYLGYHKHGYEIAVVGESINTAKYIGIDVKKVIIRTLILSGIICGIMGFIFSGCINGTMTSEMADGRGFTAVLVTWLANFNPLSMALVSLFVVFIDRGVAQVNKNFGIANEAFASVATGIIFLCIIGCEFFINYKLIYIPRKHKEAK